MNSFFAAITEGRARARDDPRMRKENASHFLREGQPVGKCTSEGA